jgi:hypothetical protein
MSLLLVVFARNVRIKLLYNMDQTDKQKQRKKLNDLVKTQDYQSLNIEFKVDEEPIPDVSNWGKIDEQVFSEDRFRIKGLIPKEGTAFLASVAGDRKTWLAMYIAHCISEGIDFLDNPEFKTIKGKVLYVNAEMSVSEFQRRGRLLGFKDTESLVILNTDNFNLYARDEDEGSKHLRWFIKYIFDNDIDVVVIDTFRAVAAGLKEEKAEEIRQFFKSLAVLKDSGVSIIILEHLRKPNNFEGRVPKKEQLFGSQDKTANVEILLMIKTDEVSGEISVYQRKNRLGEEIKPFKIIMSEVIREGKNRIFFKHGGGIDDKENKKELAKETIINILQNGESKTRKEILDYLQKEAKIGSKNASDALRELEDEGILDMTRLGRQNTYFISKEEEKAGNSKDLDMNDIFIDSS